MQYETNAGVGLSCCRLVSQFYCRFYLCYRAHRLFARVTVLLCPVQECANASRRPSPTWRTVSSSFSAPATRRSTAPRPPCDAVPSAFSSCSGKDSPTSGPFLRRYWLSLGLWAVFPPSCANAQYTTSRPFAQWNLILAHLQHSKVNIAYRIFRTIRRTWNPLKIFSKIEGAPYNAVR